LAFLLYKQTAVLFSPVGLSYRTNECGPEMFYLKSHLHNIPYLLA